MQNKPFYIICCDSIIIIQYIWNRVWDILPCEAKTYRQVRIQAPHLKSIIIAFKAHTCLTHVNIHAFELHLPFQPHPHIHTPPTHKLMIFILHKLMIVIAPYMLVFSSTPQNKSKLEHLLDLFPHTSNRYRPDHLSITSDHELPFP